ncbi:MAG TPA: 1-acyl-sn-glycerol-3-phosphate acyltransferase [Myxococcaceae bacterium]|nr:1-acyl-sn-glycerol-3-phosphate acyltransferase [Myxococcaceae bacterium]
MSAAGSGEFYGLAVDRDAWLTKGFLGLAQVLARYHRHRVENFERLGELIQQRRRTILVGNHALSVYDPLLFVASIYSHYGVAPRFVAHEVGWFKVPIVRWLSQQYNLIPSSRKESAAQALEEDRFLMLFPGGASEAGLRNYWEEPYQLRWGTRSGFLRLALELDAEIVFVAAVGSENAIYQTRLKIPERLLRAFDRDGGGRYAGARLPLSFPSFPVQVTHVVAPPLDLGDRKQAREDSAAFSQLHARISAECQAFLDEAVRTERERADPLDRATRRAQRVLNQLGL